MYCLYCTVSLQFQVKSKCYSTLRRMFNLEKIKVPRRCLFTSLLNINVLLFFGGILNFKSMKYCLTEDTL